MTEAKGKGSSNPTVVVSLGLPNVLHVHREIP
jgi:hypothetical protein